MSFLIPLFYFCVWHFKLFMLQLMLNLYITYQKCRQMAKFTPPREKYIILSYCILSFSNSLFCLNLRFSHYLNQAILGDSCRVSRLYQTDSQLAAYFMVGIDLLKFELSKILNVLHALKQIVIQLIYQDIEAEVTILRPGQMALVGAMQFSWFNLKGICNKQIQSSINQGTYTINNSKHQISNQIWNQLLNEQEKHKFQWLAPKQVQILRYIY